MKLLLHRELNCVTCFCGKVVYYSHCCDIRAGDNIQIEQCEYSCIVCEEERERQRYEAERWWKDRDGYLHCGSCGEKMSDDICTSCFCIECHDEKDDEVEEYCEKCLKRFNDDD